MTGAQKMELLMALYRGIFQSKARNTDITAMGVQSPHVPGGMARGRWFRNSETGEATLRGFDFDVIDGQRHLQLRMLEQNPDKKDPAGNLKFFANLARQGHSIVWVIDRKPGGSFLGRIQDGQWHFALERATTTATQPIQNTASALAPSIENIPDIPADIGIPDYVIQAVANDEEGEYVDQYV
jgi:hypothetical protein